MTYSLGGISCSSSLRSPEPVPVSALSGNDQGREVEVDLAARQIALDADFLSVAPKPLVAQNRDILESARERLNDALARIGA